MHRILLRKGGVEHVTLGESLGEFGKDNGHEEIDHVQMLGFFREAGEGLGVERVDVKASSL